MVNIAELYGLSVGSVVDVIGTMHTGTSWDFSREDHRQAARDSVCSSMPMVILGTDLHNVLGVDWGNNRHTSVS